MQNQQRQHSPHQEPKRTVAREQATNPTIDDNNAALHQQQNGNLQNVNLANVRIEAHAEYLSSGIGMGDVGVHRERGRRRREGSTRSSGGEFCVMVFFFFFGLNVFL